MLEIAGAATIVLLFLAIMSGRVSPLVALILVPVTCGLVAGLGAHIPAYIIAGVSKIAPVAGMFIFAILFFGIMTDAGLLAPLVSFILRLAGTSPQRITLATAMLALLIHLDGSGAVCFLVTIPALRPLYDHLGMDRRILACTASMAAGVNFLPWTGPTIRASASLRLPVDQIFAPIFGVQLVGLTFVFLVSWLLGKREAKRLGLNRLGDTAPAISLPEPSAEVKALRRPKRLVINGLITAAVVAAMVSGRAEPIVVFMLGTAVALVVNYPTLNEQRERIEAHASAAILMAGVLFAAGVFTGILGESGMIKSLAANVVGHVPSAIGPHLHLVLAVLSMPLSLLFDPDTFYFGILPVIADVAGHFGLPPIKIAQAALMGQMTTGFPVSPLTPATFLVAGLSGIELGAHQRFSIPWLFAASLVMTLSALIIGVF